MTHSVWLFGAGPMAQDYQKVLANLECTLSVFGRGQTSAQRFEEETGHKVITDSFESRAASLELPDFAILAVGVEGLCDLTCRLVDAGVSKILVEKPAGINRGQIQKIHAKAAEKGARVWVGYNRRFYDSVDKAKELIAKDGGLLSMHFEFTEWSHKIAPLDKPKAIKEIWALGNSSHVMDLAFYLAGFPEQLNCVAGGGLEWHPSGSIYAGSGLTDKGTIFSYHANWESAGRWGVELLTRKRKLFLKPLEELHLQLRGQLAVEKVDLSGNDDSVPLRPGLLKQVQSFLKSDGDSLCSLEEHLKMVDVYYRIANYG